MADKYTLTFEEAIRAMLDGKYAAAEDINSVFRFNTKVGFQHRTYDGEGNPIWKQTLAFLGGDLPQKKWMIIETIFDPCPFCGSSLFSHSTYYEKRGGVEAQFICRECDSEVTLRGKDMDEIRDKWNWARK
jgi:hypothetical protein